MVAGNLMTNYLFNKTQRYFFILLAILYCIFSLYTCEDLKLNANIYFQPYSNIVFVFAVAVALFLMKRKNWKTKIKLLTLAVVLIFMTFNTMLQLHIMHNVGSKILNEERAMSTEKIISFDNVEKQSKWIANEIQFEVYYRIGKIILLDILAIFAFFAI